jgi:hypothetical protein
MGRNPHALGVCVAGKVPVRGRLNLFTMPKSFYIYLGTNVSKEHKQLQNMFAWADFYRQNNIVWRDGRNILQELEDEIKNFNSDKR